MTTTYYKDKVIKLQQELDNKDEEIKDLKKHQNYFLFFLLGFIASLVVEKFL